VNDERDPSAGSAGIDYATYLRLDELLSLQQPRSSPEHPDELLFIVVHQASELWFRVIIRELDALVGVLARGEAGLALWHVQRINALTRIVSAQLSSLDTLPPQHFLEFRGYLGTSSGSQSIQFRVIEAASGLREPGFLALLGEHGEMHPDIGRALARPTLQSLFLDLLVSEGTTLEALYTGPGPTLLFFLAEALLEYEQRFAEWRFKHVQLVERVIGPATVGTGGTPGSRYLSRTVPQRFFPELWAVRSSIFGGGMPQEKTR
jgi:tryptophan 2,3-dioxygenase